MRLKRKLYVTQTFLPPREEFDAYMDSIYASHQCTNAGPLLARLERELAVVLKCERLHCVSNATLGLILALHALELAEGEVITTPFSYVATVNSILWERCTPVFADIKKDNFTLDPQEVEKVITPRTRAIMPVHVFGYACDVEALKKIADSYKLKIIYDAAHSFGTAYGGRSILDYGDISICSLHATKLFHSIEGGICVSKNREFADKIELLRRFGHTQDEYFMAGINAKMSEAHAAMGLSNLAHLPAIHRARKNICHRYDHLLSGRLYRPSPQEGLERNYAYYPVLFENERQLLRVFAKLEETGVYPRRYFYPSLNTLPYLKQRQSCPVSEDTAPRAACLPLFYGLEDYEIDIVCATINAAL